MCLAILAINCISICLKLRFDYKCFTFLITSLVACVKSTLKYYTKFEPSIPYHQFSSMCKIGFKYYTKLSPQTEYYPLVQFVTMIHLVTIYVMLCNKNLFLTYLHKTHLLTCILYLYSFIRGIC